MVSPHLPIDFDLVDDLLPRHLEEWTVGSGVAEGIVRLNVTSMAGESVLEELIGDRLEEAGGHAQQYVTGEIRKLIHSREQLMEGGWWVEGIDTQNGCRGAAGWGIFKPDNPIVEASRTRKYEHRLGVLERIVALRMPDDPDYWARIKADPSIQLVLDEGAKKAGAWLTVGIPALALPGLWAGAPPVDRDDLEPRIGQGYGRKDWKNRKPTKRQLHPDLAVFAPGRRFVISLDFEPTVDGRDRRDAATKILAEQLFAAGASSVAIAHRERPEKGSDDLLVTVGPEGLHDLLAEAKEITRGPAAPTWQRQPSTPLTGDAHQADLLANFIADRIYAGRQWAHQNDRAITDASPLIQLTNTPGTGKSHLVPQLGPRILEIQAVDRVIYVSDTYRSPSIGELQRWAAPPTRHNGLVVETIEGQQRLRRRKRTDADDALVEQPSCQYSGGLQRLRDQGAQQETISKFCKRQCPVREGCRYRQDLLEFQTGLKSGELNKLRCSVESIPALEAWLGAKDWARTFLVFDEAPQIEKSQVRTGLIKLERFPIWGSWLRSEHPAAMATPEGQQLSALLDRLANLPAAITNPEQLRYGLQPQQLINALPAVPDPEAFPFLEGLEPDANALVADADRHDITTPVPALLPGLLRALRSSEPGTHRARAFYSPSSGITVITGSAHLQAAALSSAGSLVLDGTAALFDIHHALHGGSPAPADHLAPIAVSSPSNLRPATLEIVQIPDLGPCGANRGEDIQRRIEALLPALQIHTADRFGPTAKLGVLEKSHFRSREAGHGIWFVDNQGSNAFEHDQAIAMVGTPAPNLTASLAQFQVTHHNPTATINSSAFRDWYGRRMGEQIIQGLHRLRPIRRQGETLLIFLITNLDLSGVIKPQPGVTFTTRSSGHFTKAAAPKRERTRDRVVAAIRELHTGGVPASEISVRRVAGEAGVGIATAKRQSGDGQWLTFVELCIDEH